MIFDHKQSSQKKRKRRFDIESSDEDTEDQNKYNTDKNQTQNDDEEEEELNAAEINQRTLGNGVREETRVDLSPALGPSSRNLKDTMYSRMTKKELIGII